jgi:hypothetical protein
VRKPPSLLVIVILSLFGVTGWVLYLMERSSRETPGARTTSEDASGMKAATLTNAQMDALAWRIVEHYEKHPEILKYLPSTTTTTTVTERQ